jgi:hypothetical protein
MSDETRDVLDKLLEDEPLPCGCSKEVWGCDCGNTGDLRDEASAYARNGLRAEVRALSRLRDRAPDLVEEIRKLREAIRRCVVELEAVQKHDGHAPSTESLLDTLHALLPETRTEGEG